MSDNLTVIGRPLGLSLVDFCQFELSNTWGLSLRV